MPRRPSALDKVPQPFRELNQVLEPLILGARGKSLEDKVEAAVKAIRMFYELSRRLGYLKDGLLYVGFSGGKDSLVVLDLAVRAVGEDNVGVVYIEVTDNTLPENINYVYKVVEAYGLGDRFLHLRRDRGFYELVERWGWPSPWRRWCTKEFKQVVLNKGLGEASIVIGVKLADSGWRKRFIKSGVVGRIPGWKQIYLKPIFSWSGRDVLEYIERFVEPERGVGLNPLYRVLGSSGNCAYCPFNMEPCYYLKLSRLYPGLWERMLRAEEAVKRGKPFLKPGVGRIGFREIIGLCPRAEPSADQPPQHIL